jgi:hypothetical protein
MAVMKEKKTWLFYGHCTERQSKNAVGADPLHWIKYIYKRFLSSEGRGTKLS